MNELMKVSKIVSTAKIWHDIAIKLNDLHQSRNHFQSVEGNVQFKLAVSCYGLGSGDSVSISIERQAALDMIDKEISKTLTEFRNMQFALRDLIRDV